MADRKMNMLFIYGAFRGQAYPVAKELERYFNVTVCHYSGEINQEPLPFEIELPNIQEKRANEVNYEEIDIVYGFDPSAIGPIGSIKEYFPDKKVGCNFLDIPVHTFKKDRNFHPQTQEQYKHYFKVCETFDFLSSWKEITSELLSVLQVPFVTLFGSPSPIFLNEKDYPVSRFFCYSGIIRPDKGVHLILEAISLIENPPTLLAIGVGQDLKEYANYLKVPYVQLPNASNLDKFKNYYSCMAVVSFQDNPYITTLCTMEAIALGKPAVVADFPEARYQFKDYAIYVEPLNVYKLSQALKSIEGLYKFHTYQSEARKKFYTEERSVTVWVDRLYEFLISQNIIG